MAELAAYDCSAIWSDLCRRLDRSVRLYEAEDCRQRGPRIELSAGTRAVGDGDRCNGDYEAGARVPAAPWRTPGEDEQSWLIADAGKPSDLGRTVGVVRVGEPSSDLRKLGKRAIIGLVAKVCDLNEPLHCIPSSVEPAGLITTTVNTDTSEYTGLHVDNWDDTPLDRRDQATNRIAINLGRAPRFFLYLPLSVMEIAELMADEIAAGRCPAPDYTGLGRLFMEKYPQFPVVRCRLAPNEAYIAPTENLVHDGSSEGQVEADEKFTILGHIRFL